MIPWLLSSLLTQSANADPVQDCYDVAEFEFPSRSIEIKLGPTTLLSTSDLAATFDKIAELGTAGQTNLELGYNHDGKWALRSAMDCIFDAGVVTYSATLTNQRFNDLRVRNRTVTVRDGSTLVYLGEMFLTSMDSASCSAGPVMRFQTGPVVQYGRSFALSVAPYGSSDFINQAPTVEEVAPCRLGECEGSCLGECDEETGQAECVCHGGVGKCSGKPIAFIGSSMASVLVVGW